MILSVSRRTDIPAYFSDWFINRIREGYILVRNPMNHRQVSRIDISPEVVDCIVFWTKNPIPMIDKLDKLTDYHYYFQYTLTGFEKDFEKGLPDKETALIPAFQKLSSKIGRDKVIWRYDPIAFNHKYTKEYHLETFEKYAKRLNGYTDKCVISFIDVYDKIKNNLKVAAVRDLSTEELTSFAKNIADIAKANGMEVGTCAEAIDLEASGINHNHCIDKELIEKIIGYKLSVSKDKTQRNECGCFESIDIGTYNTCSNGCIYCYANYSPESVKHNISIYDCNSPMLCSEALSELDKVSNRKVKSLRAKCQDAGDQMSVFDFWN